MQHQLPLSRDERLQALQGVDPDDVGITRRAWRNVFELLRQIEYCGGRSKNSFARVSVLAGRMQVAERTVQRAAAVAIEAGLLVRSSRSLANGQGSNEWAVQWDRIAMLAWAGDETLAPHPSPLAPPQNLSPTPDELSPPGDKLSPTPDGLSPPIEIDQSPLRDRPYKVDRPTVDQEDFCSGGARSGSGAGQSSRPGSASRTRPSIAPERADWDRAVGLAVEVTKKLPGTPSRKDWDLVVKVAVLSSAYGERWLWDAVEGVRVIRPSNVWGYLWACWSDGARQQQRNFRRDLAALELPTPAVLHRAILKEQCSSTVPVETPPRG